MYWLNGVARQLSAVHLDNKPQNCHFIALKRSKHGSLFVTLTPDAIHLWSAKPTVLVSKVDRTPKHVTDFGENRSIIWKPDATSIVIVTSKNYLLLYTIQTFDTHSLKFNFNTTHPYITGPGEANGSKTMLLKFRLTIRIEAGVASGAASDDTLVIATQTPPAIQCISWNASEVNMTKTTLLHRLPFLVSRSEAIKSMIIDKAMNVYIWVASDGRCYFVLRGQGNGQALSPGTSAPASSTSPTTDWAGYCFHGAVPEQSVNGMTLDEAQKNEKGTNKEGVEWNEYHHATCVAVNTRFSLIAVGSAGGDVFVYSAHNYTSAPTLSHTLSLRKHNPSFSRLLEPNRVTSLAWTSDGYALAVGGEHLGISVWSVYGALLVASVRGLEEHWWEGATVATPTTEMLSPTMASGEGSAVLMSGLPNTFTDSFLHGVDSLFWGPGNHDLYVLTPPPPLGGYRKKSNGSKRDDDDGTSAGDTDRPSNNNPLLFCLPFAKSAVTVLHSPENTKRGFLLLESSMLLYSGGEHNDITAINPDAIVWSHIQYPAIYITEHWPIRYATINSDGRYVAIAGRRGLAHYNMSSGRWKLFGNQQHEREFVVRGGMAWYKHVLIAACQDVSTKSQEIRLYSRETNLDNMYMLYSTSLHNSQSTTLHLAISGSYLTVYCSDNVIYVYLIERPTLDTYKLELLREISLVGIVNQTGRVRGMSMLNATGIAGRLSTLDELLVANIVLLVDGKLVLLRSHVSDDYNPEMPDTHFDLYILADMVECYWIGNKVVGNLESSIWAVDGQGIKIFTNLFDADAFNVDSTFIIEEDSAIEPLSSSDMDRLRSETSSLMSLPTSPPPRWKVLDLSMASEYALHVRLDFYPLSIMLDKGIIMGVEQSISIRTSLDFAIFKIHTKTHLFLHHLLTYLLSRGLDQEAVTFGRAYEKFVYFGHALEILLHRVLEDEADRALGTSEGAILPSVVKFLDHFSHALDVIVGCARKTEVALWEYLFSIVGNPKDLFEMCMAEDRLKTATSYLIILHTLQPLAVGGKDTVRLLQKALDAENFELCKELVRFLNSIDSTGQTLQDAVAIIQARENGPLSPTKTDAQMERVVERMATLGV